MGLNLEAEAGSSQSLCVPRKEGSGKPEMALPPLSNLKDYPQRPISSSEAPPPKGPTTFQINATSYGPSVQTHEPRGNISLSNCNNQNRCQAHTDPLYQSCGCREAHLLSQCSVDTPASSCLVPETQAPFLACLSASRWCRIHTLHLELSQTIPRNCWGEKILWRLLKGK